MTIDEWLTGPNWGHEEYRHADGLATLIWTSDISGAHRLARQVDTGLAWIYCDGASLSTLNFSTFSQVAFDFRVTRGLIVRGLVWALAIGAAGGLLPAIRAARLPVTVALRTG